MPHSTMDGKSWAIERVRKLDPDPEFFLDIGAGAGLWLGAIKPWFPDSKWLAVEVYEPYIKYFMLPMLYNFVFPADARNLPFPQVDVVIVGDVLEHMTELEAIDVWDRARLSARQGVVLSIPIVHYAQPAMFGNEHERHVVEDWDIKKVLDKFKGITDHYEGEVVGAFWGEPA